MKILTVDWDRFFPSTAPYDWGHSEHNGFFAELCWPMRAYNRPWGRPNEQPAIEVMRPSGHEGFWEQVLDPAIAPTKLIVADSHSVMNSVLKDVGRFKPEVVNYDAHHDMGYGVYDDAQNPPDCANWAWYGFKNKQMSKYTQVAPRWRAEEPEDFEARALHLPRQGKRNADATITTVPPEPAFYSIVVICRSSCWTPSWSDGEWMKFIGWWEQKYPRLWASKGYNEFALKPRSFSPEDAKRIDEAFQAAKSGCQVKAKPMAMAEER